MSDKSKEKVVGKVMEELFNDKGVSLTGGSTQLKSGHFPEQLSWENEELIHQKHLISLSTLSASYNPVKVSPISRLLKSQNS